MSNLGSHLHHDANLSDANPRLTQFWLWWTSQQDTYMKKDISSHLNYQGRYRTLITTDKCIIMSSHESAVLPSTKVNSNRAGTKSRGRTRICNPPLPKRSARTENWLKAGGAHGCRSWISCCRVTSPTESHIWYLAPTMILKHLIDNLLVDCVLGGNPGVASKQCNHALHVRLNFIKHLYYVIAGTFSEMLILCLSLTYTLKYPQVPTSQNTWMCYFTHIWEMDMLLECVNLLSFGRWTCYLYV